MAWTYSNWTSQSTSAARLTRLRLHVTEVSDKVGQELAADGKSVGSSALQAYLGALLTRMDKLEGRSASAIGGGVSVAGFGSTVQ